MGGQMDVNKANLLKRVRKSTHRKRISRYKFDIFEKAIRKLEGGGSYEIRFPSADWGGNEIAIEIHCAAGRILPKTGSRAKIGICVFFSGNRLRGNKKC